MKIEGETIRVEVEGDAKRPALVLSNSLGTDLSMWDGLMPALLERFRVVRYDTRGHGGSAVPERPLSIERLGRDVLAILDELEIGKAHICGISMGGAITQWLLANAPQRIERAVLACTAATFGAPDSWNARILAVRRGGLEAIADATMERWFSSAFSTRNPDAVARVRTTFVACPPDGYVACCSALRDLDLHAAIEDAETPVLVLTGMGDPVIDKAATAKLLAALPHARHVELDARHIACIEAEAAFLEAVIGFLTAKLPPRRRIGRTVAPAPRGRVARRVTTARLPLAKPRTIRKAKTAAAKARKPAAARPKARRAAPNAARLSKVAPLSPAKKGPTPTIKKVAPKTKLAKASTAKASTAKATSAKPAAKTSPRKTSPRKASPSKTAPTKGTRRPTKVAAVRGAVKKMTKARPAAKLAKKTAKPAKRAPPRRKPATAPRRPTGRRKT